MANTSVYTGADGSITLSTPDGAEGEAAQTVLGEYDLISVGRVQTFRSKSVPISNRFMKSASAMRANCVPAILRCAVRSGAPISTVPC